MKLKQVKLGFEFILRIWPDNGFVTVLLLMLKPNLLDSVA